MTALAYGVAYFAFVGFVVLRGLPAAAPRGRVVCDVRDRIVIGLVTGVLLLFLQPFVVIVMPLLSAGGAGRGGRRSVRRRAALGGRHAGASNFQRTWAVWLVIMVFSAPVMISMFLVVSAFSGGMAAQILALASRCRSCGRSRRSSSAPSTAISPAASARRRGSHHLANKVPGRFSNAAAAGTSRSPTSGGYLRRESDEKFWLIAAADRAGRGRRPPSPATGWRPSGSATCATATRCRSPAPPIRFRPLPRPPTDPAVPDTASRGRSTGARSRAPATRPIWQPSTRRTRPAGTARAAGCSSTRRPTPTASCTSCRTPVTPPPSTSSPARCCGTAPARRIDLPALGSPAIGRQVRVHAVGIGPVMPAPLGRQARCGRCDR